MAINARLIQERDDVATLLDHCRAGEEVTVTLKDTQYRLKSNEDISFGHKIAIRDIKKGGTITKYGEPIGIASADIRKGDWVHTHNLKDDYKIPGETL